MSSRWGPSTLVKMYWTTSWFLVKPAWSRILPGSERRFLERDKGAVLDVCSSLGRVSRAWATWVTSGESSIVLRLCRQKDFSRAVKLVLYLGTRTLGVFLAYVRWFIGLLVLGGLVLVTNVGFDIANYEARHGVKAPIAPFCLRQGLLVRIRDFTAIDFGIVKYMGTQISSANEMAGRFTLILPI